MLDITDIKADVDAHLSYIVTVPPNRREDERSIVREWGCVADKSWHGGESSSGEDLGEGEG
jgi:hypothetical protein